MVSTGTIQRITWNAPPPVPCDEARGEVGVEAGGGEKRGARPERRLAERGGGRDRATHVHARRLRSESAVAAIRSGYTGPLQPS